MSYQVIIDGKEFEKLKEIKESTRGLRRAIAYHEFVLHVDEPDLSDTRNAYEDVMRAIREYRDSLDLSQYKSISDVFHVFREE